MTKICDSGPTDYRVLPLLHGHFSGGSPPAWHPNCSPHIPGSAMTYLNQRVHNCCKAHCCGGGAVGRGVQALYYMEGQAGGGRERTGGTVLHGGPGGGRSGTDWRHCITWRARWGAVGNGLEALYYMEGQAGGGRERTGGTVLHGGPGGGRSGTDWRHCITWRASRSCKYSLRVGRCAEELGSREAEGRDLKAGRGLGGGGGGDYKVLRSTARQAVGA